MTKLLSGSIHYCRIKDLAPQELKDLFPTDERLLLIEAYGGGAIATVTMFETFSLNPAHLFPDGVIKSFNVPVGHKEDLEILEEYKR